MKLKLQTQVDKWTFGEGAVHEYDSREKLLRSLKTLGLCWLAAVFAILIPVFHFVLVPGLLILGPLMAWVQSRQGLEILRLQGSCAECKKEINFKKSSGNWPLRQTCPHCSCQIYVEKSVEEN